MNFKQRVALMNLLCRICGREEKNCISLFSESGKRQQLEKKIRCCLPLVIEEGDKLPKQICLKCLGKLDATWELVQLCKSGQVIIEKKLHGISEYDKENEDDIKCGICNNDVKEDEFGVGCEGQCRRWFHCACLKMPKVEYLSLVCNTKKIWACPICKPALVLKEKGFFENINMIDEKVSTLSEDRPITIGDSAVITLVPVEELPQPQEASPSTGMAPVSSGMVPAYQVSDPVTTAAPMAAPPPPAVDNNVYPQGLIQVLPSNKPVLYQERANVVKSTPSRRNIQSKRSMKSAEVSSPRPNTTPRRSLPTQSKRVVKEGNSPSARRRKRVLMMCKYCKKSFPDEIIDHHVSLHLRQSFFTCIDCNKNFRSEMAMSRHRCDTADTSTSDISTNGVSIDLDPDDDLICL